MGSGKSRDLYLTQLPLGRQTDLAVVQGLHGAPQVQVKAWGCCGLLCSPVPGRLWWQGQKREQNDSTCTLCPHPWLWLTWAFPTSHMLASLLLKDQTSTTINLEISSPMSLPYDWWGEGRGKKHPFPSFPCQYPSIHIFIFIWGL